MYATQSQALPQPGERYSFDELYDAFPGYWVLLAYPTPLTPEESWNIMGTPGMLIAIHQSADEIWRAFDQYKADHPAVPTYLFATEPDDDLTLVAATGGIHVSAGSLDENRMAHPSQTSQKRLSHCLSFAIRRYAQLFSGFWRRAIDSKSTLS